MTASPGKAVCAYCHSGIPGGCPRCTPRVDDTQKCGTCGGTGLKLEHPADEPFSQSLAAIGPCAACAPRADGSAAEVKRFSVPGGFPDEPYVNVVLASAYDELRSAFDDRVRVIEMQLEDKKRLASRVAELERAIGPFPPVVLSMLRTAADQAPPTLRGAVMCAYKYIAALSKGSQT